MRTPVSPTWNSSRYVPMINTLERAGFEIIYLGHDVDQHGRPTTIGAELPSVSDQKPEEKAEKRLELSREFHKAAERDPISTLRAYEKEAASNAKAVLQVARDMLVGKDVILSYRDAGTDPLKSRSDDTRDGRVTEVVISEERFIASVSIYKASGDGFLSEPVHVLVANLRLKK